MKRRKYQLITFALCASKLYMISCLQGSMTVYVAEFDLILYELRIAYLIGVMIVGNLVDNIGNPKRLMVGLSFSLAFFWLSLGVYLSVIDPNCSLQNSYPLGGVGEILSSSIVLIDILQLYNWFGKKHVQLVLLTYFAFQFLGYLTPIKYVKKCDWSATSGWCYLFGGLMVAVAALECKFYYFSPLMKNIFLDQTIKQSKNHKETSPNQSVVGSTGFGGSFFLQRSAETDEVMSVHKINETRTTGTQSSKLVIDKHQFYSIEQQLAQTNRSKKKQQTVY